METQTLQAKPLLLRKPSRFSSERQESGTRNRSSRLWHESPQRFGLTLPRAGWGGLIGPLEKSVLPKGPSAMISTDELLADSPHSPELRWLTFRHPSRNSRPSLADLWPQTPHEKGRPNGPGLRREQGSKTGVHRSRRLGAGGGFHRHLGWRTVELVSAGGSGGGSSGKRACWFS